VHSLLRVLEHHGVPDVAAKTIVVLALFLLASIVARILGLAASHIRARVEAISLDSPLVAIAQRETAVALIQTTVRYLVFFVALVLAITTVTGAGTISTVAGASFVAVIIGFAAQRFLIDLMAGFVMFFEGWYTVGSTVVIEPMKLAGVVEDVSLRATKIRDVSGEVIRVHNSQILAVRVFPDGGLHVLIELFVHDADAGERLIENVAKLLPTGPTAFRQPPRVLRVETLDDDIHRITDLIVHGPVILPTDEHAETRFARAGRFSRRPATSKAAAFSRREP